MKVITSLFLGLTTAAQIEQKSTEDFPMLVIKSRLNPHRAAILNIEPIQDDFGFGNEFQRMENDMENSFNRINSFESQMENRMGQMEHNIKTFRNPNFDSVERTTECHDGVCLITQCSASNGCQKIERDQSTGQVLGKASKAADPKPDQKNALTKKSKRHEATQDPVTSHNTSLTYNKIKNSKNDPKANKTTLTEPKNKSGLAEPKNQSGLAEPKNKTNFAEPKNKTSLVELKKKTSFGEPENKANLADPKNKTSLAEPKNKTGLAEPKNKAGLAEPKNQTSLAEPKNKTGLAEPKNKTGLAEPKNKTNFAEPRNKTSLADPKNKTSLASPKNTTSLTHSTNDHLNKTALSAPESNKTSFAQQSKNVESLGDREDKANRSVKVVENTF